jgi:mRNA interferase MazF
MPCKPGDLVLIPFPFSDLKSAKRRPVMVLTSLDRHNDFIGLAVTSVEQRADALRIEPGHLAQGALPRACWIRFDKIFTLSESSIVKTFGAISPQTLASVLQGLCSVVGYAGK